MLNRRNFPRRYLLTGLLILLLALAGSVALAHPLGNFTINHYSHLTINLDRIQLRYIIDLAEIPAYQERATIDTDHDGTLSQTELNAYAQSISQQYANNLRLDVDGIALPLSVDQTAISLPPGAGGLSTLRLEYQLSGQLPVGQSSIRQLHYQDGNDANRIGWREIVVTPGNSVSLFNSTAYGNGLSDELKSYPADLLLAPLNERSAELSFSSGTLPAKARPLLTRDGHAVKQTRDPFTELITVPELTPTIVLLGLLVAALLGGFHALSPGHGKTVVGAYLVGSRGTARHAAFLGLTVTITHTAGVFALGLITLFASKYIVPEKIFPILSLISGGIVLAIGLTLFVRRLTVALGYSEHVHEHHHGEGADHSHLPPDIDGTKISWRNLLALGISGGLLPCPSALVVLLAAISLHRIGYGLLLVLSFSFGLAGVLTAIGLLFVYAKRFIDRPLSSNRLIKILPVCSAFVISLAGLAICYEAINQAGFDLRAMAAGLFHPNTQTGWFSAVSILSLGFVLGLKHALEADHLAAVSTIVSESKSLLSSSLVGGLWGVGHTISLLIAGVAVILLHLEIGERTALGLEFCVGIMLVVLGANALIRLRRGGSLHLHSHQHGGHTHLHPHLHDGTPETDPRTHHNLKLNLRPLIVGMVHGLAGSAALMLLVVATTPSALLSLAYIVVFGIGSIGGMMMMSLLVGMPIHFTTIHFSRVNFAVRAIAGIFSFAFGLFMVYKIGYVEALFR